MCGCGWATIDEIALEVSGTVIERLDLPVEPDEDDSGDEADDDEALATPLHLAIDVDEAPADGSVPSPAG
jgi:exoribonuclease II